MAHRTTQQTLHTLPSRPQQRPDATALGSPEPDHILHPLDEVAPPSPVRRLLQLPCQVRVVLRVAGGVHQRRGQRVPFGERVVQQQVRGIDLAVGDGIAGRGPGDAGFEQGLEVAGGFRPEEVAGPAGEEAGVVLDVLGGGQYGWFSLGKLRTCRDMVVLLLLLYTQCRLFNQFSGEQLIPSCTIDVQLNN